MPRVIVHRHSARYLQRLPRHRRDQMKDILNQMKSRLIDHLDIIPMSGEWAGYRRLRAGNLRVIFWYDEKEDVVFIDHIGPRGDVYK